MRLSTADLLGKGYKDGHLVTSWPTATGSAAPKAVATAQPGGGTAPILKVSPRGVAGVVFDGKHTMLSGMLDLNASMSIIAVLHDTGSPSSFSSVFVTESFRGMAISASGCKTGYPAAPGACNGQLI